MIRTIIKFLQHLLTATAEAARHIYDMLLVFGRHLFRVVEVAFLPEVLLSGLIAFTLVAILVLGFLGYQLLRRKKANVFISFHHGRQEIADSLSTLFSESGLQPTMIRFDEQANHDELLDSIQTGIRKCDVFVCVPGEVSSFVDHEVAMAFGLEKPMIFVVSDDNTARIPNTAKKGYPVFSLTRLADAASRPLQRFCSYVARDWQSNMRIHSAVFDHLAASAALIVLIYLVSVAFFTASENLANISNQYSSQGSAAPTENILSSDSLIWFLKVNLTLLLIPTVAFGLSRRYVRSSVRKAVAGRIFSESYLPKRLDDQLTRSELISVLVT